MTEWMKNMYELIKSGKDLTESQLRELAMEAGSYYEIGHGRWTTSMVTILNFDDDETYLLFWEKGLTEYQENIFENQPVKVDIKSEIKVVKFAVNHYTDSSDKELFKEEVIL